MIPPALAQSVLATRNPALLLRLSGWFLLRLAERRFCGLLFQEPPRRTRNDGGRSGAGAQRVRGPTAEEIRSSGARDALSPAGGASHFGDNARKKFDPPSAGMISAAVLDRLLYSRRKEITRQEVKAFWQHETRHRRSGCRVGTCRGRPSGGTVD